MRPGGGNRPTDGPRVDLSHSKGSGTDLDFLEILTPERDGGSDSTLLMLNRVGSSIYHKIIGPIDTMQSSARPNTCSRVRSAQTLPSAGHGALFALVERSPVSPRSARLSANPSRESVELHSPLARNLLTAPAKPSKAAETWGEVLGFCGGSGRCVWQRPGLEPAVQ